MIDSTQNPDKQTAVLTHASGIFLGFLVPLIVWLTNRDKPEKQWLTSEALEALNFQITLAIAAIALTVISMILFVVVIGAILLAIFPIVLWVWDVVLCIIAAVKANNGEQYRYPLTLRLIN